MEAVVFALISALAYGVSDFIGGILSKTRSVWMVTVASQLTAGITTFVIALVIAGQPTAADFAWAAGAGLSSAIGISALYRGLSRGRMGVVAPISAIGAALVPVAVGLVIGDKPSLLAWLGIIAAFPAIYLVARTTDEPAADAEPVANGVLEGVIAGLGFGVLFTCIDQIGGDAGWLPLAFIQFCTGAAAIAIAVATRQPWLPRGRAALPAFAFGPLGTVGLVCFHLATQHGLLAVVSVIASLYPAGTVMLAAAVLDEKIARLQSLGLGLAAIAVALVVIA